MYIDNKMIVKLIITLLLGVVTFVLYFAVCKKKDPYQLSEVRGNVFDPVIASKSGGMAGFIGPGPPEYYPLGYGPQSYGANNDYLPDSLYTKPLDDWIEFENLNFEPYMERIWDVNNLLDHDLRNF
jgi:hypothetical protein